MMTIPEKLTRFDHERALFIVTGKQIGKLYYANGSKISELETIEVPSTKYSDREGFFMRSGSGKGYGAGSVQEPKDQETKRRFLKKLADAVKNSVKTKKIDSIYIFSPNYAIRELKEGLAADARSLIRASFMGNYVKFAPLELARKISERRATKRDDNQPFKLEEIKIMKRPRETVHKASRQK